MISALVLQHAEEAAFAWALRDYSFRTPHHDFAALRRFDERCEANLDGLRTAGAAGWAAVADELGWRGASEVFVGSVLAAESTDVSRCKQVLGVAAEMPEVTRGIVSALGWVEAAPAERWIARLTTSSHALERFIAVAASAIRRRDPGTALANWIADVDPRVRARAWRAVGELGRTDLLARVLGATNDDDTDCRFWATASAVLLGHAASAEALRTLATLGGPFAERAADLAARRLDGPLIVAWRDELTQQPKQQRLAIHIAGAHGDPACLPWLIEQMDLPPLARIAGEAFASITGVDFVYSGLAGKRPEGFKSGPNDDPADENVALDADEDLPFPAVDRVRAWWAREHARFTPGVRYLLGQPINLEVARRALRQGKHRQRAAGALELALAQPGLVLFEVRERADRQLARLRA